MEVYAVETPRCDGFDTCDFEPKPLVYALRAGVAGTGAVTACGPAQTGVKPLDERDGRRRRSVSRQCHHGLGVQVYSKKAGIRPATLITSPLALRLTRSG
jgi:hypothetical protein